MLLFLFLLAPAPAPAGTITVNDLMLPLSASSAGFATTSLSIDSVTERVTFDGTYVSTGGFLTGGKSITYTVVFIDPDGSTSDATTLTIGGIPNPNPPPDTIASVDMLFQGLVTSPINGGPNVFFIPEPNGWFDVAAYLRGQPGVIGVPGDLSVLVASAIPEPASLVLAGIAVVAGVGIRIRRWFAARS
jgi:hypothetical protein